MISIHHQQWRMLCDAGIVRGRPVPIPGNGMQLTNIAHVRDLSSMLALAVSNPGAAAGKIFNCVSDRAVTLNGMARLCAAAAGAAAVEIVHYDPATAGVDAKKAFPFRNMVSNRRASCESEALFSFYHRPETGNADERPIMARLDCSISTRSPGRRRRHWAGRARRTCRRTSRSGTPSTPPAAAATRPWPSTSTTRSSAPPPYRKQAV